MRILKLKRLVKLRKINRVKKDYLSQRRLFELEKISRVLIHT